MAGIRFIRLGVRALVIALFALGILAAPAAAADGTVTGTVTVNGVLASSGIGVGACPVGEQGPFCPSLNTTFTEIDGTYDLVLPEGQWNVGTFNPDPFFLGSGQTVDVPGGGSVIVNLVLDYGTVAGSVTVNGAPPPAGTGVAACRAEDPQGPSCPSLQLGSVEPDGTYSLGLPAGNWKVAALVQQPALLIGPAEPVTVTGGQTTSANLVLNYGAVTGTVHIDGNPAPAGVFVGACPVGEVGPFCPSLRAQPTQADGTYNLLLDAEGAWNVGATFAGTFGPSVPATITFGQTVNNVDLVLDVAIGTMEGTVTDPNGAPLTGLSGVSVCPGEGPVDPQCAGHQITTTNSQGVYGVALSPGTYAVLGFNFPPGSPVPDGPVERSVSAVITIVDAQTVTCAFTIGAGSTATCMDGGGTTIVEQADAGDTVTTDPEGTGATESDPVQVDVTTPNAGEVTVTLVEEAPPTPNEFFAPIGEEVLISAPDATVEDPLVLVFRIDASEIVGIALDDVVVFKDGVAVSPSCTGTPGYADPDPCVSNRVLLEDGDAEITVLSSTASRWSFGVPDYEFSGFLAPVNGVPTLNAVKAGQAVPVKFGIGGDGGLDILATGYPKSQAIACDDDAATDGIEQTLTAGESSLSYDASTGTYTYVWKTNKDWTDCRQLVVKLADGTLHRSSFQFK